MFASGQEDDVLRAVRGGRLIRNIELAPCDFQRLIDKKQLTSVIVNGVCAKIQTNEESSGHSPHWCIFSSWLGPIVEGKAAEKHVGTFDEHVKWAVPSRQFPELLARTIWAIPLCSFKEPCHWILAWIDFSRNHICFFDSMGPDMASTSWAEPVFLRVLERIFLLVGKEKACWNDGSWTRKLYAPSPLCRQIDNWSCGVFVFMALFAVSEDAEKIVDVVGWDRLDEMRWTSINLLLDLPAIFIPNENTSDDGDSDIEMFERADAEASVASVYVEEGAGDLPEQEISEEGDLIEISSSEYNWRKRKFDSLSECSDDELSDQERRRAKRSLATKKTKAIRLTPRQRLAALENDEWIDKNSVTPQAVKCKGCSKSVKLSNRSDRPYEIKNWSSHKSKCPRITRVKIVRTSRVVKGTSGATSVDPKTRPLTSYFGRQEAVKAAVPPTSLDTASESTPRITFKTKVVIEPPPITNFLPRRDPPTSQPGDSSVPQIASQSDQRVISQPSQICKHLSGSEYDGYISLITTRDYGGLSFRFIGFASRQLFPYKAFPPLKEDGTDISSSLSQEQLDLLRPKTDKISRSSDRNAKPEMPQWTETENQDLQQVLEHFRRWVVDYDNKFIKSAHCPGTTANRNGISDECMALAGDESLKRSIRRKREEAAKPQDERREILKKRTTYASSDKVRGIERKLLQKKLSDPVVFDIYDSVKKGEPEDCFLRLYKLAREGKLKNYERFQDVCTALSDRIIRDNSDNKNAKFGIRYTKNYLDFMTIMRGHGHQSNVQYEIFSAAFGGPSVRHLRALVTKSEDALKNPALVFENMARLKRYTDSVGHKGAVIFGGDCTGLRKHLNYSVDFGSHVLGSVLPLSDVEVDDAEDIDEIVGRVAEKKAYASQARAIIAKIPLPRCPPIVVALLPTDGKETADDIHIQHQKIQQMAAQLKIPIIAMTADGAACELSAQLLMDAEQSEEQPLTYEYPLYGVSLHAPVFKGTGPLISVTDPPHARKTCRNQPQYGTHTASMGIGYLVNSSFVKLYETQEAGLVVRDVENVDKQDDGAARRMFHSNALAATCTKDGSAFIRPKFEGLFVYLFVMGSLFEAWMNPSMPLRDRIVSAFRARFWLHYWRQHISYLCDRYPDLYSMAKSFISPASFHIFNRLCDTLVLLALAYSEYYPDQLFCPWLIDTGFVEHFFGIARQILPNFSYAEFVKMAQHVMVRQRILESGIIRFKKERNSAVGYIYNSTTDMREESTSESNALRPADLRRDELKSLIETAHDEAVKILREILQIPVPALTAEKPVKLHALGSIKKSAKKKPAKKKLPELEDVDEISDEEGDIEEDESDTEGEEDDTPSAEGVEGSIDDAAAEASKGTARYAALSKDLEDVIDDYGLQDSDHVLPAPHQLPSPTTAIDAPQADVAAYQKNCLLDQTTSKVSIQRVLDTRRSWQSGTTTKSERTVKVSDKFTDLKNSLADATDKEKKFSNREASHRLRVAQELNTNLKKQETKKTRQLRWQAAAAQLKKELSQAVTDKVPYLSERNVTALQPIKEGSYLIMRSEKRYYIGEVLDLYKKGQNSRYGSVKTAITLQGLSFLSLRVYLELQAGGDTANSDNDVDSDDSDTESDIPDFSCAIGTKKYRYHLHTHAPVENVVYHLGTDALTGISYAKKTLTALAASRWKVFSQPKSRKVIAKQAPLKIRIPGGKFQGTGSKEA